MRNIVSRHRWLIAAALVGGSVAAGPLRAQPDPNVPPPRPMKEIKRVLFVGPPPASPKPALKEGSAGRPFPTLVKAMEVAVAGDEVRVAAGEYKGLVVLKAGVIVRGGYAAGFNKTIAIGEDSFMVAQRDPSTQTVLSNPGGDRVVVADKLAGDSTLSNLVIVGADFLVADARSTYGVVVQRDSTVRLERVKIVAGKAGAGKPGAPGTIGTGFCTPGGEPGTASNQRILIEKGECHYVGPYGGCSYDRYAACSSGPGKEAPAVTGVDGQVLSYGGNGGGPGWGQCAENNWTWDPGKIGSNGEPGQSGFHGAGGSAGRSFIGTMRIDGNTLSWVGDTGVSGGAGWPGAGGGGGGAGGSRYPNWQGQCPNPILLGGAGGKGGQGGCAGQGGEAGGSGGGSFGVLVWDATVVADGVGVLVGEGGPGGPGGPGGDGAAGQPPPAGGGTMSDDCGGWRRTAIVSGPGGPGGGGGKGGSGGGGAGGTGGIAVGVARVGDAVIDRAGLLVISGGKGGGGGTGGKAHGESGRPGAVYLEYHLDAPSAAAVVFQTFNPRTGQYSLSAGPPRSADWIKPTAVFAAYRTQQPGTDPVYLETSKLAPNTKYNFSMRSVGEAAASGWVRVGVAFYAYARPTAGAVQLYIDTPTNARDSTYTYTTAASPQPGWSRLSTPFYVLPLAVAHR